MSPLNTILVIVLSLLVLVTARPQLNRFQHIAVIENDAWEQTLPSELRNPFYKTPRVRNALAKSSWFGPGEMPVLDRQAEKIARREIYNVLSHAGLIERRNFL
ncbi:uncharacterized protein LOC111685340 [Lucilia cuprina]|uniref:uncharacterized protein LOC111685340 n=1 Tax=Lucilia cuprina TaxID=7375 RepID=UPI000C71C11A|nr:uncharacterized protein LOC111685340 [Lucilia cuprina]XP_037821492.1 uncharacterized protein LOC119610389 [Lucilia sericata]